MKSKSLFASDHQIRIECEQDALDAMATVGSGLIFRAEDVSAEFFELSNGLAGAVFQKFMNYGWRVVFVLPADHQLGDRVTELAREHVKHSHIRIVHTDKEALDWLSSF